MKTIFNILLFSFSISGFAYSSENYGLLDASQSFLEKLRLGQQATEVVSPDAKPQEMFAPKFLGTKPFKVIGTKEGSYLRKVQFDTTASITIAEDNVLGFVKQYLDEYYQEFKVRSSDLSSKPTYQAYSTPHVYTVVYTRELDGLPLQSGFVEFNFSKGSKPNTLVLREILNQSYGDVSISNKNASDVSESQLKSVVGIEDLKVESKNIVVIPKLEGTKLVFLKTTQYIFSTAQDSERYYVAISNGSHEIMEASPLKYQARSFLKAEVLERNYLTDDRVDVALPRVGVSIGGNSIQTEADGGFEQELPFEAVITLKNNRVDVTPANSRVTIGVRATVTDNAIQATGDDFTALNAFTAINRVNQFVRRFIDPSETRYLSGGIRLRINVAEGTCNAYYSGEISMYREGGGCANMSRVNDVMYHEWGHGLDDYTGRNIGIQNGAFSEGIGDIVSAYMTDSPNMGAGFFLNNETGIRNLDNNKRYPQDQGGGVHSEGEIIGGAFWSLREALIERYGETKGHYKASYLFFRHLLVADTYRESFDQVVKLDDDDGNPATQSPNFCLIVDAFKAHGLSTENDCEDVLEESQPVDESVFIGLKEIKGEDHLVVSVKSANSIYVCKSEDYLCDQSNQVKMSLEGKSDEKLFFVSDEPFSFSNHLMLTAVVKDATDAVTGVKRFKVVGR